MRRVIGKDESADSESFMKKCVENFNDEFENIIYYGVQRQRIDHPSKPNEGIVHIHSTHCNLFVKQLSLILFYLFIIYLKLYLNTLTPST